MTEKHCGYSDQREQIVVAYLYDEIGVGERAKFQAHLAICPQCRDEVTALTGVRSQLALWAPPEPGAVAPPGQSAVDSRDPVPRRPAGGRTRAALPIPLWAQAVAAMLLLGVAAGIANLDVRYNQNGLSMRTGWSKTIDTGDSKPADSTPWHADVAALEQRLRTDFQASHESLAVALTTGVQSQHAASPAPDAELVRRLRGMIDESERRQQRELALRVADVMRELDTQRRADLVKIDRSLGLLQNNTGVEVMKQRELLNYLVRVSQKQ
jgi:putative zinc finger protein